jgi:S-adenosylmethionine:tRNA ribosyltransferase-isomerase
MTPIRTGLPHASTTFALDDALSATEPPESRGVARDDVRLLVASANRIRHTLFRSFADHLAPGDLVVVNTSATLAAAVDGTRPGPDRAAVTAHFSTRLDDATWLIEFRPAVDGSGPVGDIAAGEQIALAGGAVAVPVAAAPGAPGRPGRLWRTDVRLPTSAGTDVVGYLDRYGRPITYSYVRGRFPLADYQTVFARDPGSAEMPSAGRPFTTRIVTDLATRGVTVAPITLHTGVSSLEEGEPPLPEPYSVPATTARLIEQTRRYGGRVVAVGTTVTRALETVARPDGSVLPGAGWTDLVLGPDRRARVVDGLVTGWHAPGASHLLLLEAVAGPVLVAAAYAGALAERYRWHEFGDSCLLLP